MTAKFNLATQNGVANFEQAAAGMARDLYNTTFFNKPSATAEDMWEQETFQADQMEAPYGVDEQDNALALADDMEAARTIYLRVAEEVIENNRD